MTAGRERRLPWIAAALSAATFTVARARGAAADGEGKDDAENLASAAASVAAAARSPRVSEGGVAEPYKVSEKYAVRKLTESCKSCHGAGTGGRGLTISGLLAGACPLDETGEPQILDGDEALSEEALADCCTETLDDGTTRKWTTEELKRFLRENPDHNITDADWDGLGWNVEEFVGRCADDGGTDADDADDGAPTSGTAGRGSSAGAAATSTALFSTLVLVELFRSK